MVAYVLRTSLSILRTTLVQILHIVYLSSISALGQQLLFYSDVINGQRILTVEGILARIHPPSVVFLCRRTGLLSDFFLQIFCRLRRYIGLKGS